MKYFRVYSWEGSAAEPRAGLPSGHIPNSLSCPFANYLLNRSDDRPYKSYRSKEELESILMQGVGGEDVWERLKGGEGEIIFACGSGMTAVIGWLALQLLQSGSEGAKIKASLYDEVSLLLRPVVAANKAIELDRIRHATGIKDCDAQVGDKLNY